jgi:ParB-like chromosome segregation protein Spo0J
VSSAPPTFLIPTADLPPPRRFSEAHVEEFVELLEYGRRLPPVTVRWDLVSGWHLVDGNHRLEAHRRLGLPAIAARAEGKP